MTTTKEPAAWKPARILVPTDLTSVSECALDHGAALSRHFGSHLYLAHVIQEEGEDSGQAADIAAKNQILRRDAEQKMAQILQSGKLQGVQNTVLIEQGYLWQTLESILRKYQIDLVVVGTHGQKDPALRFQGSWAELIFRHAECPVMTVGPGCEPSGPAAAAFARILFATDFGRPAQHAVPYACSLAQEYSAHLTLLNVVQDAGNLTEPEWSLRHETTRVRLVEFLPDGMDRRIKVDYLVERGDSARQILSVARSKQADLIVLGAKIGRKLVTHLPEPTAYTVAAHASCPVLTVSAY